MDNLKSRNFTIGGITITLRQNIEGGEFLVSSLEVATAIGKRHDHFLRTIDSISYMFNDYGHIDEDGSALLVSGECYYINDNNRKMPLIMMNRDMVLLAISKSPGHLADRYTYDFIQAFNVLEQVVFNDYETLTIESYHLLSKSTYGTNLSQQAIDYENIFLVQEELDRRQENELLINTMDEMLPAYVHGNNVMKQVGDLNMQEWAISFISKNKQIGRNTLLVILRDMGYIQKGSNLAYKHHIDSGMFRLVHTETSIGFKPATLVTAKGIAALTYSIQNHININNY